MKVAVFTDSLHFCGVREVTLILLRALESAGWLLTFCGAAYPGEDASEFKTITCKWLWSICISKTGMRISLPLPWQILTIGLVVRQTDLIIIESNSFTGACAIFWAWFFNLARLITRRPKKKILFHAHTQADEYVKHIRGFGWFLARFVNTVIGFTFRRVDQSICPSDHFANMLQKRLKLKKKPKVWISPLNIPDKLNTLSLDKLYYGGDRRICLNWKVMLCNGRLGGEKSTGQLLHVFGLMHQIGCKIGLIFIGGGDMRRFRRIADNLPSGAGRFVSFFGRTAHRRLLELTSAGEENDRVEKVVGVTLSHTDTQGLCFHEQWWFALATVALGGTCFSDDIAKCEGGIVVPDDPEQCAHALISFVKNTDLRRECGQKGQKFVLDTLSYERCVKELVLICAETLRIGVTKGE